MKLVDEAKKQIEEWTTYYKEFDGFVENTILQQVELMNRIDAERIRHERLVREFTCLQMENHLYSLLAGRCPNSCTTKVNKALASVGYEVPDRGLANVKAMFESLKKTGTLKFPPPESLTPVEADDLVEEVCDAPTSWEYVLLNTPGESYEHNTKKATKFMLDSLPQPPPGIAPLKIQRSKRRKMSKSATQAKPDRDSHEDDVNELVNSVGLPHKKANSAE